MVEEVVGVRCSLQELSLVIQQSSLTLMVLLVIVEVLKIPF